MRSFIKRLHELKRDKRGISNVIVVVLGLVILVTIVANVFLWNYEMSQFDWERTHEEFSIVDVSRVNSSSWFVVQNEYQVNVGQHVNGSYTDTHTVNDKYESFKEISDWWNTQFLYRRRITIINNATLTLEKNYTVCVTLDTASLVSAGKMLSDGSDLRIVYLSGDNWIELDREVIHMNTTTTQIWFATQTPIEPSQSDENYYIYYGNPSAVNPPEDKNRIYLLWDDFSGTSLDGDKWASAAGSGGSVSVSGGILSVDRANVISQNNNFTNILIESKSRGVAKEVSFFLRATGQTFDQFATSYGFHNWYLANNWAFTITLQDVQKAYDSTKPITQGTWYIHRFTIFDYTIKIYRYDLNYNLLAGPVAWTDASSTYASGYIGFRVDGGGSGERVAEYDWVKVRKYMEPEPLTFLGVEEEHVGFAMEWGTVVVDDGFVTVNLVNAYRSPVVVCVPSYTSGVPRTVRLKDVNSTSFKVRVQNPSGTMCPATTVHFLVVEEGVWTEPIKLEARKYDTNTVGEDRNWDYDIRSYGQTYSGTLVVFHQVMTYNDAGWITTYVSKIDRRTAPPSSSDSGFRIALNGAEAVNSHGTETIGYVVVEQGQGTIGGVKYDIKRTADFVQGFGNSPPYNTPFSQTFSAAPQVVVSSQLEMDGTNGGWVVDHTITQTQAGLMIDEDQVKDNERWHTTETCGFWAFEIAGNYSSANNRLSLDGVFKVDLSTYPLDFIETVEIVLRYRVNDLEEKWYLEAYNWTGMNYNDDGFNFTSGHVPTSGWNHYSVNLTNKWRSYVRGDGVIYVRLRDEKVDEACTTIDMDFLGVRVKINGTKFTFKNKSAMTVHIVSLWIINSTVHQRYDVNFFVNPAETRTYIRVNVYLPESTYVVKAVTERGNMAVFSSD